ncbi:MAG: hypothetical protein KA807_14150 [Prolixibacteraceae bacterium]|nr:hypothetical protein [Prolixibacteraceae bacterium]
MKNLNEVERMFIQLSQRAKETSDKRNALRKARVRYVRKQPMKLLDMSTGLMQCKICGATHFAQSGRTYVNKLGDRVSTYKRGAWQCQNGCKY